MKNSVLTTPLQEFYQMASKHSNKLLKRSKKSKVWETFLSKLPFGHIERSFDNAVGVLLTKCRKCFAQSLKGREKNTNIQKNAITLEVPLDT